MYPYIWSPHAAGIKCTPTVGRRTLREATVRRQSVAARCGKPLQGYNVALMNILGLSFSPHAV
ncbi:MAG: hypothetical protein LBL42_06950, partial [Tannerella sp.]|nr:hypothetical protein [Tannerella sp.]